MESSLKRLLKTLKKHQLLAIKIVMSGIAGVSVGLVTTTSGISLENPKAMVIEPSYQSYNLATALESMTTAKTTTTTTTTTAIQSTTTSTTVSTTKTTTIMVTTTVETTEVTEASTTETVASVETEEKEEVIVSGPSENHLTKYKGVGNAPNGFVETYYDLDMSGVVSNMRRLGFSEEEYPYWVDEVRGTKMFGPYIIVAADTDQVYFYNFGDIVETDLGTGIVCDTGTFRYSNPAKFDVATAWDTGYYPGYNG